MRERTERNQKIYRVFAIYGEVADGDPMIYIGRTKMANLATVLRYYRNESKIAKDLFQPGMHPEIFLLEEERMTVETAYQHCIAWIRLFLEQDYDVIARRKPYEDAFDLYGGAEAYYRTIMRTPAEYVLSRRYEVQDPDDSAEPLPQKQAKKQKELSRRLSIRLAEKDYQAFSKLCEEKCATQKECLRMLMLNTATNESYAAQVIQEKNREIAVLEKENEKLRQDKRRTEAHERLKEAFRFARRGVSLFLRDQLELIGMPKEDDGEDAYRDIREYKYPEEGFLYFRLEETRRGKGSRGALFLLGHDCKTEEKVKLRFYPKEEFCGISPISVAFYVEGAEFFVGCRRLDPEVADLLCAFPVFQEHQTDGPTAYGNDTIDDILRDAERRSKVIW